MCKHGPVGYVRDSNLTFRYFLTCFMLRKLPSLHVRLVPCVIPPFHLWSGLMFFVNVVCYIWLILPLLGWLLWTYCASAIRAQQFMPVSQYCANSMIVLQSRLLDRPLRSADLLRSFDILFLLSILQALCFCVLVNFNVQLHPTVDAVGTLLEEIICLHAVLTTLSELMQ